MFKNYFKIAWRNMQKQKMYALINIGGFAIGIAACLLIALYINNEMSYDTDNPNKNDVFRIVGEAKQNDEIHRGITLPAPMAKALLNDFPEVKKVGRTMSSELFGGANNQVRRADEENDTYESGFCFADSSVMDILNVHMIYGDQKTALAEPNSVVICKSMADKYFKNENPVGKVLIFNDNTNMPLKIGGVMQDFPSTSHLQYRGFISLAGINFWNGEQEQWTASNYQIYLQLTPNADVAALNKKMTADVLDKYMIPAMIAKGQKNAQEALKGARIYLQPLTDIHLLSYNIDEDNTKHGDIRFIYLFAAIATFILILACINFLNLSTARSANRAKEVGVRKVLGSDRSNLIKQFLTESLVYSFLSCFIGVGIAVLVLPAFSNVSNTQLHFPWHSWWLVPSFAAFAFVIGIIAGLYPAFYLSYFKPVNTLKGNLSSGSRNTGLRSTLVVFQFTVSIILLIGTAVSYRQMQYILNSKIGFNKDEIVVIKGTDALQEQTTTFRNELLNLRTVKNASISDFLPVTGTKRNSNGFTEVGKENTRIQAQSWVVDENYITTLGMKIIAGRNFSVAMKTDSAAIIINKAFADKLGSGGHVIGKKIVSSGNPVTIIGVVDNFYFESMKQQVDPLCMALGNSNSIISVKVNAANMQDALASITALWKKFQPYQSMRYDFLDQTYASMYADVQRMQYIFTGFAILAIIVACIGLFALAAFMAEQRSKEVSIRKILGASVANLFALLTGNFLKLVFISLCIAIPAGWLLMNQWLQDYAYRIKLTWDIFAMAGFAVLFIALLTICSQAIKTAIANPVKSLRSE